MKGLYKKRLYLSLVLSLLFLFTAVVLPKSALAFSFIDWGDTKSDTTVLKNLSVFAKTLAPSFTTFAGDLESDGFTQAGMDAWKAAMNGGVNNGMFDITLPVRGNHDDHIAGSAANWQAYYNDISTVLRVGGTNYSALNDDLTYSFDYDNSRFIGVDIVGASSLLSSAQISWIDSRLTDAESRGLTHAFLYFHGPIYCVAEHCSCSTLTGCVPSAAMNLITVINKHPIVSAVFNGHEHVTTYTHLDSTRIPGLTRGLEQFVIGDAGAGPNTTLANRTDYVMDTSDNKGGFVFVNVNGGTFTVNFYHGGVSTPVKTYTFTKVSVTPPPSSLPTPTSVPTSTPAPTPTHTPTPVPTPTALPTFTPVPTTVPTPTKTPSPTNVTPPSSGEIILDNDDVSPVPGCGVLGSTGAYCEFATTDAWANSSYVPAHPGVFGTTTRKNYCSPSGDYAQWSATISKSGFWTVSAWWTSTNSAGGPSGRISDAKYDIFVGSNTSPIATVTKDQRVGGGAWNMLGSYSFASGDIVTVRVRDQSSFCGAPASNNQDTVSSDAIRLAFVTVNTPTPVVTATPTPVALLGDANGDGLVNEADYSIWLSNFKQTVSGGSSVGDFNSDGKVDGIDYSIWFNNYGRTITSPTPTATAPPTSTPTPTMVPTSPATPTPVPTPIPTSFVTPTPTTISGSLLWWGDADTNGMSAWKSITQCPPGDCDIVDDPLGRYGKVYRTTLNTGDVYTGDNTSRAELYGTKLSNGTTLNYFEGDEYYYGWRSLVSNGIYTNSGNSGNFLQLKGDSSCGGPAVGITMENGLLTLRSELYGIFWKGPAMTSFTGNWHDIVIHVLFSKDATKGFVEAWLDGVRQTFTDGTTRHYMATMCPNDSYIYLKMGYYRGSHTEYPSGTHWFESPRLGTSYSAVVPR